MNGINKYKGFRIFKLLFLTWLPGEKQRRFFLASLGIRAIVNIFLKILAPYDFNKITLSIYVYTQFSLFFENDLFHEMINFSLLNQAGSLLFCKAIEEKNHT